MVILNVSIGPEYQKVYISSAPATNHAPFPTEGLKAPPPLLSSAPAVVLLIS